MSKLEDMIRDLCPEGVQMVKLGEVCEKITDGSHNPPRGIESSKYRMISSLNVQNGRLEITPTNVRYLSEADFIVENKRTNLRAGDLLLTIVGTIGRAYVLNGDEGNLACQRSLAVIRPQQEIINSYFLFHYLLNITPQLETQANGAAQKGLYLKQLSQLSIPLPPLPIQEKIVEILENFSLLSAELEAELEGRRKQYDFYRNRLLSFDSGSDSVVWKALGEVCTKITDGSHTSPKSCDDGFFMPSVKDMQPNGFDFTECKRISKSDFDSLVANGCKPQLGDVLIAKDGSMLKYAFAIEKEEDIVILSSIAILRPKDIINAKYLAHYFRQESFRERTIREYSSKGGVPRIVLKNFKQITIPIPPLAEQERIVRILDKFEALVTDLSSGLPAEIERVQKQYEYYRNKLLTFPEV